MEGLAGIPVPQHSKAEKLTQWHIPTFNRKYVHLQSGSLFNCYVSLPECSSKFAPENGCLEYFTVSFWGPAYFHRLFVVSFRECMHLYINQPSVRVFFDASIPMSSWHKGSFPLEIEKLPRPGVGVQNGNLLDLPDSLIHLKWWRLNMISSLLEYIWNFPTPNCSKKDTSNIKFLKITCRKKTDVFSRKPLPCSKPQIFSYLKCLVMTMTQHNIPNMCQLLVPLGLL